MAKVALVTGAGRGIGAACALRLASDGYDLCLNYREDETSVDEVANQVMAMGRKAIKVKADVSNETDVLIMFDEVDKYLGPLSLLVNNAGILFQQMPLLNMTAARMEKVMSVNVVGTMLCSREAVRRMSKSRGGAGGNIVNLSSAAARLGSPNEYIDYASSKGAIDTFTIGLAKEVANEGIRVNGVRPGLIYTSMHADGGEPDRIERLKQSVPMGRGGEASEVAATVSWLASDDSSYVTGTLIDVSGGR